tara:strand:- start:1392 stop:2666 length:1275 start_codon:yes stop_codon:yes gene_type:complete
MKKNNKINETKNLLNLVEKYRIKNTNSVYPLLDDAFSSEDLIKGIKVILTGQLTMSKITLKFEQEFAKKLNAKYAVMVNSGSSANLLATFAACNPLRKNKFKPGDEALIQALCWPTSLWPLTQTGLKPVFVDVNSKSLNVNADDLLKKITSKTKVIMIIHVLGNSPNIEKIRNETKKRGIILIEDTCESLGAKYKNKFLGTYGDFGTYSFYYSHQISSGEGGMIVCNNFDDYQLLLSMRSHGWSRNLKIHKNIEKHYPKLDKKFIFINSGFNLRPTDIVASIGLNQFKRLDKLIKIRTENRVKIIKALKKSTKWKNQYSFLEVTKNVDPSFFGFPIFLNDELKHKKKVFLKYLEKKGVETRPIITGNFLNQPAAKLYKFKQKAKNFPNAQKIEDSGFFIGLHSKSISEARLNYLIENLLKINEL